MSLKLTILIVFFCGLILVAIARAVKKRGIKINSVGAIGKGMGKWFEDENTKYFFPAITPILVYAIVLVSFYILLPDLWQKYWERQEFFWISQVYLVVMVALGKLEGFWLKWMPRILFSVILFTYIQKEWPKPEETTGDVVAETTDVRQDSNTNVRTVKIVAHPDKWVKVNIPSGYDWQFDSNPAYGLENIKTLIAVRINGDERTVKRSGMLQDGSISNAFFERQASYVEFKSEDKNSAYLLVHITRK